eukprot:1186582-Prorocentrum_minimum.AAC.3
MMFHCEPCVLKPCYGRPGKKPSRCANHVVKGMMFNPMTMCGIKGCEEVATIGNFNKPIRCEKHKGAYDVDHVLKDKCTRCGSVSLLTIMKACHFRQKCFQYEMQKKMKEEEYPAPGGGWARCEHHDEQLGPGAPRPCRRVATTGDGLAGSSSVTLRPLSGLPS